MDVGCGGGGPTKAEVEAMEARIEAEKAAELAARLDLKEGMFKEDSPEYLATRDFIYEWCISSGHKSCAGYRSNTSDAKCLKLDF